MITVKVRNQGNAALEQHQWKLSIIDAKVIKKHFKGVSRGSYEYINWVKPINVAIRNQKSTLYIYTSGFSTSEFANILRNNGLDYVWE